MLVPPAVALWRRWRSEPGARARTAALPLAAAFAPVAVSERDRGRTRGSTATAVVDPEIIAAPATRLEQSSLDADLVARVLPDPVLPDPVVHEPAMPDPVSFDPIELPRAIGESTEAGPERSHRRAAMMGALRLVLGHLVRILLFSLPAIVLWWHVWTGHPTSTLTCACGDVAQEVWFIAWPAWAVAHLANPFFSHAINVPFGANLLSNTSGTLIGIVLAPVTKIWGPIAATNVALTLAPGLSAWGCWLALRRYLHWKAAAIPAALIFGYSAVILTGITVGHASVVVLVLPPLIFANLYEILVRQEHGVVRDGLCLLALVLAQFWISPEILVMCALFAVVALVVALVAAAVSDWGGVRRRAPHAWRSLVVGLGPAAALLAYPAWFGIAGPQSVSGPLFLLAPIAGIELSQFFAPGNFASRASHLARFTGYRGRNGPPVNYLGYGVGVIAAASVAAARRRPLVWLLVCLGVVAVWLSLGSIYVGPPTWLGHIWLPWRELAKWRVFDEIIPAQIATFIPLFVALLIGLGLDAGYRSVAHHSRWPRSRLRLTRRLAAIGVGLIALIPIFMTFDVPLTVSDAAVPAWMAEQATQLPPGSVLLTVPFAVSGIDAPMLWQAVDAMHFSLAGAALKTPNARGGPVGRGLPGSARRILTDLSMSGEALPSGTPAQLLAVRGALGTWHVSEIVIDGASRDPVYASGFIDGRARGGTVGRQWCVDLEGAPARQGRRCSAQSCARGVPSESGRVVGDARSARHGPLRARHPFGCRWRHLERNSAAHRPPLHPGA